MSTGIDFKLEKRKLLVVEGKDGESLLRCAVQSFLNIGDIQVVGFGGRTELKAYLANRVLKDPGYPDVSCMAVVRDAEDSAEGALASVKGTLESLRLPCPIRHGLFAGEPLRVGVFIMPDGAHPGKLESLCMESVADNPEISCLSLYFDCLREKGIEFRNMDKARAHAWLASCPEPGKRLGEAAQAGYWNWDHPSFAPLWDFLRNM